MHLHIEWLWVWLSEKYTLLKQLAKSEDVHNNIMQKNCLVAKRSPMNSRFRKLSQVSTAQKSEKLQM